MNLRETTIGVIGGGTVGKATARCYLEHVKEVCIWDVEFTKCTHKLAYVLNSSLVFVCLPEGEIEGFFSGMTPATRSQTHFVIKSTVPIGTTERLAKKYDIPNLVHSPEFLTERCALTDATVPARNIIGIPVKAIDEPFNQCAIILGKLYEARFPGTPLQAMTSDESEAVKLMTNAAFAVKVSLFNEFRALSDYLGLDWGRTHKGIISDPRVGSSHTEVPGHDGQRGFGGKCLSKDLDQLIRAYREVNHPILAAVKYRNRNIDRRVEKGGA